MSRRSRLVLNVVLLQLGWFACVLGAARGNLWLGPVVVAAIVSVHVSIAPSSGREALLIVAVGLIGAVCDSILTQLGFLKFDAGTAAWMPLPIWMIALWLNFATGLNVAFRLLAGRWGLAAILGCVGGVGAYFSGVKLGALTFHPDTWPSLLAIGVEWAVVTPVLVALAALLRKNEPIPSAQVVRDSRCGAA